MNWLTNGAAVFRVEPVAQSLSAPASVTNFDHFVVGSLNHLVWTNFIARTNGRDVKIWATRAHGPDFPRRPPALQWNTNSVMWGMRGLTAISPCWEDEGSCGQAPITALTRRHGVTRGHGMGPDGVVTARKDKKVWFLTRDNKIVEVMTDRMMIRTLPQGKADYTIVMFNKDLPESIIPMRVVGQTNLANRYPILPNAPKVIFESEQFGNVNTHVAGLTVSSFKPGDSGSPNMLPLPGELVFFGGRGCFNSGPTEQMQADIDALCKLERVDPKKYQLQWVDISKFPTYSSN